MKKTYRYKLYRSKKNKRLVEHIEIAAHIYNHCIALHKRYYKIYGAYLGPNRLKTHLTMLKKRKGKYSRWRELGSQAAQDVVERIHRGYRLFFSGIKKKRKTRTGKPSYKKRRKYKSFTLKQSGYKLLDGNMIEIGGIIYRYSKSRDIEGKIKTVTVKRDILGDIYIFVVCEQDNPNVIARTGKMVGYDFGLKRFLTASDGNDILSPLFFMQNIRQIKKLNRSLSRKMIGSKNRKKAKHKLARTHKRIADKRTDFFFKLAAELCEQYTVICLEDLNIKAMQRRWGRKISDISHSSFVRILKDQAFKVGTEIVEISRYYPSSKACSYCGHVLKRLPLHIREWQCPDCGITHDRDSNAATNILREGASSRKML